MTRPRVYHAAPGEAVRLGPESEAWHYLNRVVRVRAGEEVVLFSGDGVDYVYRVEEAGSKGLALTLEESVPVGTDPSLSLALLIGVLKGDRVADVIRSVVPLGADRVVPFLSERSVRRPKESVHGRWKMVADEAVRQCGRTRPAAVDPVRESVTEALAAVAGESGEPIAGLVFWEESERSLEEGLQAAAAAVREKEGKRVVIAVGPEGGFEEGEVEAASDAGLVPCRLGPRVLRAELAAVTAVAVVQHRFGDLR
jgi:16S rRNA (uracil1498-N3)-methyltransferase